MRAAQRNDRQTAVTRARYDRIARFYDMMESGMERGRFSEWRPRLWAEVRGPEVLEVGVGTGKNFPYYPQDVNVTAIDLSPRMLEKAEQRAEREGIRVDLRVMDAQHLDFPDDRFDTVVTAFVFCSVPDPVLGLRELRRVTKRDGRVLLLEHVRPPGLLGHASDVVNPVVVRLWGANVNRWTVENARRAGLQIERVEDLWRGIVKLIVARPGK
jgi:ubiquinone/menaquinone biosynthesis C-methylase UbiE